MAAPLTFTLALRLEMFVLTSGRRPLLEYLRNLGPQVLLLTGSLLLAIRLDFGKVDLENTTATLAFYFCFISFWVAWWANTSTFLDALIEGNSKFGRALRRFERRHGRGSLTALGRSLLVIFRTKPVVFVDVVGSIILINVGFLIVAVAGFAAAKSALT